jgi:hypothetical protein
MLHVNHVTECIYDIYRASVSPGSVQQVRKFGSCYSRKCLARTIILFHITEGQVLVIPRNMSRFHDIELSQ